MKKIKNICFSLFLISLFLFVIPNLYYLPIKNAFLTTQALARIIIVAVFICNILLFYSEKTLLFTSRKEKSIITLILFFFLTQSLSIFSAINITAFLSRYKDVIVSLVYLFTFYFYKDNIKKIAFIFFISMIINGIYQFLLVFQPQFFINIISNFIYQKHLVFVLANIDRGRIYIDTYDEIVIPFFFIWTYKNNTIKKLIYYLAFVSIPFFSFASNYRTRILMFVFSFIGTIFIFKKIKTSKLALLLVSILIIGYVVSFITASMYGISIYDRLINTDTPTETRPISSRLTQISLSIKMAGTNLFGVGLGNYYDYVGQKNTDYIISKSTKQIQIGAEEYVHNIFGMVLAESGYISLFILLFILVILLKDDIKTLRIGDSYKKAFVISFWTLFIYGFFNPIVPASYQVLFWGIRGILI